MGSGEERDMGAPDLAIMIDNGPYAAATDTLKQTVVKDGRITLPVDVDAVAQRLGLIVERLVLPSGTDGMLVKEDPYDYSFKAVLDARAHVHRSRFTLAHEIGHFVHSYQDFPLGKTGGILERRDRTSSEGVDEEEVWANRFAAALLMPSGIVADLWAKGASIPDMAEILNVSTQAMGLRVHDLGLED